MCNPSKKTIKKIMRMLEDRCKKVKKFEQVHQSSTTTNYMNKEPTEPGFQGVLQIRGRGQFIGVELTKKREDTYTYGWFYIRSPEQIWGILKPVPINERKF
jgi:adenosylmethionine-8-amino-7-oxononanoate aminotransferase